MIWWKTRHDSAGHDVDVPLMFVVFACLIDCFPLLTAFGHGHVTSHRCHRGYISTNVLNHNGVHLDAQLVQTSYVRIEHFYISLPGDGLGTAVPRPLLGVVWDLALPSITPIPTSRIYISKDITVTAHKCSPQCIHSCDFPRIGVWCKPHWTQVMKLLSIHVIQS